MHAGMRFTSTLIPATLVRRYKRFLADVVFESGDMATAHVPNPGAMVGLDKPFSRVWLSDSGNELRKFPYTLEIVESDLGSGLELIGLNTAQPNLLVAEALKAGAIPELRDYGSVRREVKYGGDSRADFLLEGSTRRPCFLEVENVSLMRKPRLAEFPDIVTDRAVKRLEELSALTASGAHAAVLFVAQIGSAERFTIARDIDPAYAEAFERARSKGVRMLAWRCNVTVQSIELAAAIPIVEI
jgi:sugar fermentation stimulation protein A